MTEQDLYYMKEALLEGEKALAEGEVPIGAVMVRDGEIIARGHNMRNTAKNPLRHAEIDVINEAAGIVGDWRQAAPDLFWICSMSLASTIRWKWKKVFCSQSAARS